MDDTRIKKILLLVKKQEPYGIDRERLLKDCTLEEFNELADKFFISSKPQSYPDAMTVNKVRLMPLGEQFIRKN